MKFDIQAAISVWKFKYRTVYLYRDSQRKNRQFIIEKAASIFNKKGFAGTYMSDITAATGLSKGSIYGNFKDKNEVAVEAFRYNLKQLIHPLLDQIGEIPRADQKILFFLNSYRQNYAAVFKRGGCAILNTCVDADDGNLILKEKVVEAVFSWKNKIKKILTEGIEKKELKDLDTEKFACHMIALIEGSILIAKVTDDPGFLITNIERLENEIRELTR